MPLNVEFQGEDYEREYMYNRIFPPPFQNGHGKNNRFLEEIILGLKSSVFLTRDRPDYNPEEDIELIAKPYIVDGYKVISDTRGELKHAINGEFVIELRPKHRNIMLKGLPQGALFFRAKYDESVMFNYGFKEGYTYESTNVTINLFYNP
jgi:hypothetical protein